jgi:hypothetical protein
MHFNNQLWTQFSLVLITTDNMSPTYNNQLVTKTPTNLMNIDSLLIVFSFNSSEPT